VLAGVGGALSAWSVAALIAAIVGGLCAAESMAEPA
jgi:hypothetical protein